MFCSSCGAQINDDAVFCPECGAVQEKAKSPKAAPVKSQKASSAPADAQSVEQVFMDPDEKLLASLGNGYFVNLMFSSVKKCHALLSDKRIYLKGAMYTGNGKTLMKMMEERTLDLEDITGTGFIYTKVSRLLVFLGILFEIAAGVLGVATGSYEDLIACLAGGLVPCLILIIAAFFSRKIWFFIDYAGGSIQIDAKLIGLSDVQDFHKQIRRAKDALKAKAKANATEKEA